MMQHDGMIQVRDARASLGMRLQLVLSPAVEGSRVVLRKLRAIGTVGSASLIAMALLLAPASAQQRTAQQGRLTAAALAGRPVGAFTPAVSDPRLAAALARRGTSLSGDFRFTPASALDERSRGRPRRRPRPRQHAGRSRARRRRRPRPRRSPRSRPAPTISASRSAGGASPSPATSPRPTAA